MQPIDQFALFMGLLLLGAVAISCGAFTCPRVESGTAAVDKALKAEEAVDPCAELPDGGAEKTCAKVQKVVDVVEKVDDGADALEQFICSIVGPSSSAPAPAPSGSAR